MHMPKADHFFPHKYLKAPDIKKPTELTVRQVIEEEMKDGKKPVMHFEELSKGLVLNQTNFSMMVQITKCENSDDWVGARILLDVELVAFKGNVTPGLRLHPIGKKKAAAETKTGLDDDLPGFDEEAA
jgi:hypothetical protein